mmetsp:Transcript_10118/g.11530  ORF Transcript_10118/g.11530 Transcript_10118/m.11530 type:complete len:410 (+) Transcript_10118:914-2143(+)
MRVNITLATAAHATAPGNEGAFGEPREAARVKPLTELHALVVFRVGSLEIVEEVAHVRGAAVGNLHGGVSHAHVLASAHEPRSAHILILPAPVVVLGTGNSHHGRSAGSVLAHAVVWALVVIVTRSIAGEGGRSLAGVLDVITIVILLLSIDPSGAETSGAGEGVGALLASSHRLPRDAILEVTQQAVLARVYHLLILSTVILVVVVSSALDTLGVPFDANVVEAEVAIHALIPVVVATVAVSTLKASISAGFISTVQTILADRGHLVPIVLALCAIRESSANRVSAVPGRTLVVATACGTIHLIDCDTLVAKALSVLTATTIFVVSAGATNGSDRRAGVGVAITLSTVRANAFASVIRIASVTSLQDCWRAARVVAAGSLKVLPVLTILLVITIIPQRTEITELRFPC